MQQRVRKLSFSYMLTYASINISDNYRLIDFYHVSVNPGDMIRLNRYHLRWPTVVDFAMVISVDKETRTINILSSDT